MQHKSIVERDPDQRIMLIDDPRRINLDDPETMLEYFLDGDIEGYIHIMRYVLTARDTGFEARHEGLIIGQSDSPKAPPQDAWSGDIGGLRILSEISLGVIEKRFDPQTGDVIEETGHINEDPLLIVNFDAATETYREIG